MGYIYLASPYSAPTLQVRVERFMAAQDLIIHLAKRKTPCYSPIVHWHHISLIADLPAAHEFWIPQDRAMIEGAGAFWLLQIPGWQESQGCKHELALARKLDLPLTLVSPQDTITLDYRVVTPKIESWRVEDYYP